MIIDMGIFSEWEYFRSVYVIAISLHVKIISVLIDSVVFIPCIIVTATFIIF